MDALPLPPECLIPASDDTDNYIDLIAASGFGEGFAIGGCLNEIYRYRKTKNIKELKQARYYLDWWIEFCERSEAFDRYEELVVKTKD